MAFDGWRTTTPVNRARILWAIADLIEAHVDELAELKTLDQGKPLFVARWAEIPGAINQFRFFAGQAMAIEGNTIESSIDYQPAGKQISTWTLREPVGVVAAIVPWNSPLVLTAMKLAPALAAGCTIVLKPAEDTSLSALRLGELMTQAGLPAGVLNIVTGLGSETGAALAAHPRVDKIAFTGSTQTGRAILDAAKTNFKRVTLELGGKSPAIVLPDADLNLAIPGVANAIFFNAGQVCIAGSRLYVHRSIHDQVIAGVVAYANGLAIGHGLDPATQMGPLVSARQAERVTSFVTGARDEGATVHVADPTRLVDQDPQIRLPRPQPSRQRAIGDQPGDPQFRDVAREHRVIGLRQADPSLGADVIALAALPGLEFAQPSQPPLERVIQRPHAALRAPRVQRQRGRTLCFAARISGHAAQPVYLVIEQSDPVGDHQMLLATAIDDYPVEPALEQVDCRRREQFERIGRRATDQRVDRPSEHQHDVDLALRPGEPRRQPGQPREPEFLGHREIFAQQAIAPERPRIAGQQRFVRSEAHRLDRARGHAPRIAPTTLGRTDAHADTVGHHLLEQQVRHVLPAIDEHRQRIDRQRGQRRRAGRRQPDPQPRRALCRIGRPRDRCAGRQILHRRHPDWPQGDVQPGAELDARMRIAVEPRLDRRSARGGQRP